MEIPEIRNLIKNLPLKDENKLKVSEVIEKICLIDIGLPKPGHVWMTDGGRIIIVTDEYSGCQIDEFFYFKDSKIDEIDEKTMFNGIITGRHEIFDSFFLKKLANSPKEYFAKRDEILADLRKELPEP